MSDGPQNGLVAGEPVVAVPNALLTSLAAEISEIEELQVMIAAVRLATERGGLDHAVAEDDLGRDRWLRRALRIEGSPNAPRERIEKGLVLAAGRGTLLRFTTRTGAESRVWYYLNTVGNQARLADMAAGVAAPPAELRHEGALPVVEPERPNIFRLYEQNVGLLTPLIAERIVGALERYPTEWIEDAIEEAVAYNRRNWRYIARILENWSVAGRSDDPREGSFHEKNRRRDAHPLDPDQYQHGRYLDRTGRG
jgi:DnaD/phage-associated family protein